LQHRTSEGHSLRPNGVVYDDLEHVFRCSDCRWEVPNEGICAGCEKQYAMDQDAPELEPPSRDWTDDVLQVLQFDPPAEEDLAPLGDSEEGTEAAHEPLGERELLQVLGVPEESIEEWDVTCDEDHGILVCPPFYEGLTPPLLDSEVWQVCLGWHIHAVETPDDFDDMMDALLDQLLGLMEPVPSVIPETELAGTRWATTRTVRGWLTRRCTGQELQHAVTWQPLKQADILDEEKDSMSITETASSDEEASAIETSHDSDGDSGGDSSGASSISGCDLNSSITSCVCTPSAEPAKEQAKYLMDLPTEVLQLIASVRLREQ
jgi:hypothetical protein